MTKYEAVAKLKEQKDSETKRNYEDALLRERAKRERVLDVRSDDVQLAITVTERKNDIAWHKVCSTLESQLVVQQTQVAQLQLQSVRLQSKWNAAQATYEATASTLRGEVTVRVSKILLS
jgi:hypothetical protein